MLLYEPKLNSVSIITWLQRKFLHQYIKLRLQLPLHTEWKFMYNNLRRKTALFVTAAERLSESVHVCDKVTTLEALNI
jgi:hypothetical protein